MSIWEKILSPVTDTFNKVLDKVAGNKIDDETKAVLSYETQKLLKEELRKRDSEFQNFIVQYEGMAKDMPRSIQVLRGTVRPVLTYGLALVFLAGHAYMFIKTGLSAERISYLENSLNMLFKLNLISLSFWYGEKLITRTGLGKFFEKGKK